MLNAEGNSATILVIDDDPTVLNLVEKIFGGIGYHVLSAFDASNGLAIAAKQNPDLIILDIILPGMDGFEVLKRLKGDPVTANIPVILLTVKKFDADIQRGLDLGADDYIAKPIHAGLMVKRVENVLKKVLEY